MVSLLLFNKKIKWNKGSNARTKGSQPLLPCSRTVSVATDPPFEGGQMDVLTVFGGANGELRMH